MNPIDKEINLEQHPLCDFSGFPDEIWLKIIQYLPTKDVFRNFALTCKRFNNLTQDSSAVKYLQLSAIDTWQKFEKVSQLISKSKSLVEFKIDKGWYFYFDITWLTKWKSTNRLICQAFRSNPRLKSLKIKSKKLDSETFDTIVSSRIEFLDLDLENNELPSDGITRLCRIKTLKSLTLTPDWLKEVKRDAYKNFQWNIIDVLNDNFNPKGRAPPNSPQKLGNPHNNPKDGTHSSPDSRA